jgi:glycosyltransferase involved in cell wall biosynthesis
MKLNSRLRGNDNLFMRIAFLSPFYPYRGGIAQFSDSLYNELRKTNDVKAFTFKRQYPSVFFPGKSQFVLEDDLNRGISAERVLDTINPFTFAKTSLMISDFKPDIFLLSYWMPFFAPSFGRIAGSVKKIDNRVKIVSIMHNVLPHEKRTGDIPLTKYFLNKCSGFAVLNEESKRQLLSIKPDAKYLVRAHPLYDHYGDKVDKQEARIKLSIPPDKKVILFFGLIRGYKGLDLLIEAMKKLDDSHLLLIAGEVYGKFDKYNELIEKYSLQNKIKLNLKYIPDKELPLYFSAADVCVLPYRSGTQSGIVAVSYYFRLPVIVTDTGGLKEMVEEGKTGLVVSKPEPELLAHAIDKFMKIKDNSHFEENIEKFRQEHSWKSFAEKLIEFCKSL